MIHLGIFMPFMNLKHCLCFHCSKLKSIGLLRELKEWIYKNESFEKVLSFLAQPGSIKSSKRVPNYEFWSILMIASQEWDCIDELPLLLNHSLVIQDVTSFALRFSKASSIGSVSSNMMLFGKLFKKVAIMLTMITISRQEKQ